MWTIKGYVFWKQSINYSCTNTTTTAQGYGDLATSALVHCILLLNITPNLDVQIWGGGEQLAQSMCHLILGVGTWLGNAKGNHCTVSAKTVILIHVIFYYYYFYFIYLNYAHGTTVARVGGCLLCLWLDLFSLDFFQPWVIPFEEEIYKLAGLRCDLPEKAVSKDTAQIGAWRCVAHVVPLGIDCSSLAKGRKMLF